MTEPIKPVEWKPPTAKTAPPKKTTAPSSYSLPPKPPSKNNTTDYTPGIIELLQIPVFGLTVAGKILDRPKLALDGAAVTLHGPSLASALNDVAQDNDHVARILDTITAAGPYAALFAAVIPMALQIAANHGAVPTNDAMGILSPEGLVTALEAQSEAGKRAAAKR